MRVLPFLGACALFPTLVCAKPVQLAQTYEDQLVDNFLVSEKLDGIRAIWDGEVLKTRNGHLINAPSWFTHGWPDVWLDGELWAGRNQFSLVQKTVLDYQPNHDDWRKLQYYVFDAPGYSGEFAARADFYHTLLSDQTSTYLKGVEQRSVDSNEDLYAWLDRVVDTGGEGLMLHRKDARFQDGRSDALLKLKPYMDSEAQVIGYTPGKGKYQGLVGALEVRLADGKEFRIGSGLTDEQRAAPPAVGAFVTYKYQGFTVTGLPRFATFVRERKGMRAFSE
ncbi:DNA ligase [Marinomonas ostreistagni]|uniref:DNA ligase n=1 Tax=Marinomonas ostreistagni TaxID=359209 RepID=UPI001951A891|nr:DNA ligase [Marinomonas ostreistagni]MBM6549943.1 DNA ligase [Marinomonas ostreistagni]